MVDLSASIWCWHLSCSRSVLSSAKWVYFLQWNKNDILHNVVFSCSCCCRRVISFHPVKENKMSSHEFNRQQRSGEFAEKYWFYLRMIITENVQLRGSLYWICWDDTQWLRNAASHMEIKEHVSRLQPQAVKHMFPACVTSSQALAAASTPPPQRWRHQVTFDLFLKYIRAFSSYVNLLLFWVTSVLPRVCSSLYFLFKRTKSIKQDQTGSWCNCRHGAGGHSVNEILQRCFVWLLKGSRASSLAVTVCHQPSAWH